MQEKRLLFREWLSIGTLFLLGLFLFLTSMQPSGEVGSEKGEVEGILVQVGGAVARPGLYEVRVGMTIKELLHQAGLLSYSDTGDLYMKKALISPCVIMVPEKKQKKKQRKK